MKLLSILFGTALLATTQSVLAQDDSSVPLDDSNSAVAATGASADGLTAGAMTDAEKDAAAPAAGTAAPLATIDPLAHGTVNAGGIRQSGTGNWTSRYNSRFKRYEITISGERYYYLRYSTLVTPAGDIRYCRSSSVGGKLLVYCYDRNGTVQPSRFGFVTFKK